MTKAGPRRITVLGGGNGISAVLSGLARSKGSGADLDIRAVVATADDGGSSGRLRRQRGCVAYGDLRNCLQALASDPGRSTARLFTHRFEGNGELAGHALGNLVLMALVEQEGCHLRAIDRAAELVGVCGRVLPVSVAGVTLEGLTTDGRRLAGESALGGAGCALARVWLNPEHPDPSPGVIEAIEDAELLVIGPGSLFTSILAVLLVPGVADAVRRCGGRRVLVANLMTEPGETLGMGLPDHLRALDEHVGAGLASDVLHDLRPIAADRLRTYRAHGAEPLAVPEEWPRAERLVRSSLVTKAGKIRHEPDRLASALLQILDGKRPETEPVHTGGARDTIVLKPAASTSASGGQKP